MAHLAAGAAQLIELKDVAPSLPLLLLLLLLVLQVKHYVDYTANDKYGLAVRFIGCLLATETEVLIQVRSS
jgi:hypothetical protein